MNEQHIKNLLTSYVKEEMALICEEDLPGYGHIYSNAYKKRMKRMLWSEKYFGRKLYFGYMVRRIAVVVLIILSLYMANEVSARMFGFKPWKYIPSYLGDGKMDVRTYTEKGIDDDELPAIKRDVPIEIPDGMEKTSFNQDDLIIHVEWSDGEKYLEYIRTKISASLSLAIDGEYQTKEEITVNGFYGNYCVKGIKTRIVWDDACYNHMIFATNINNSKEILMKMAESLYK